MKFSRNHLIFEQTGLSNRNMAKLIGVNQSQLSRYQGSTYNMPSVAVAKLQKLYGLAATVPPCLAVVPNSKEQAKLAKQERTNQHRLILLRKKLANMQKAHVQASQLLQLLLPIEQEQRTVANHEMQLVAGILRIETEEKLKRNGWLAQKKLLIKIAVLELEAGLCADMEAFEIKHQPFYQPDKAPAVIALPPPPP